MGTLNDINQAVQAYPHEFVEIEIHDVDYPGTGIDVGEDVEFRFRVSNSGLLHVDDLELLVEGLNGTDVKGNGAAAQYATSFTTSAGWFPRVPAHSKEDGPVEFPNTRGFFFKPSRSSTTVTDLVRVSVHNWTSSFDHLFAGHTDADTQANDTYSSTVSTD